MLEELVALKPHVDLQGAHFSENSHNRTKTFRLAGRLADNHQLSFTQGVPRHTGEEFQSRFAERSHGLYAWGGFPSEFLHKERVRHWDWLLGSCFGHAIFALPSILALTRG